MNFVHMSEKDYKVAAEVLNKTSQHVSLIVEVLKKHVLKPANNGTLLDIGSGPGFLTRRLKDVFNKVIIVEPNKEMMPFYENDSYEKHFMNFQKFQPSERCDLALCSHVLYHMPPGDMQKFIVKMMSHVKAGGKAVIALMAPRGQSHELHQKFNTYYINSKNVKEILDSMKLQYVTYSGSNSIHAQNRNDFACLVKFFVWEDCISKEKKEAMTKEEYRKIEDMINEIVDSMPAPYNLVQEEDYFVVTC